MRSPNIETYVAFGAPVETKAKIVLYTADGDEVGKFLVDRDDIAVHEGQCLAPNSPITR